MKHLLVGLGLLGLLCGCKEEPVVISYDVPKETWEGTMPGAAPTPAPDQNQMPGLEDQTAQFKEPTFAVPQNWQERPRGKMRKGSFIVEDREAKAEITVLAFPRDVGGALANINRWAGQIQAPDLDEVALEKLEALELEGYKGQWVYLEGPSQAIWAAIVERESGTWFYKMLGVTDLVKREAENFKAFVLSTEFND